MPITPKNVFFSEKIPSESWYHLFYEVPAFGGYATYVAFQQWQLYQRQVAAQAPPPQAGINIEPGVVPPIVPAVVAGLFHFLVLLSGMIEKVTASLVT
jgi:hypothetical protein